MADARIGVLTCEISPELVDEAIEACGCREKRRRLLPARTVVYFVLGMCLLAGEDSSRPPGYRQVMRSLTGGLRHLAGAALPSGPALARGRARLGSKPLELLFDLIRGPRAEPGTPGAFAFGCRVVSWDGTSLDAPRTGANIAAFGVPPGGWHPALRLLALAECGTHAVIDAAFEGFTRASEQVLARRLLHALHPGMLLLADRAFPGYELWELAAATGAELVWRIPRNRVLPPLQALADGSCLALLPTPAEARNGFQHRRRGIPARDGRLVRVIDAAVTARAAGGGTATSTALRLITTLLDPGQAPAAQVAALYHERWESENSYSELKTRLKGTGFTLRSQSPDLVCQEMYAFLAVYHALCALQADAAAQARTDPDKISFTITIRTVRDQAKSNDVITVPGALDQARRWAIADILGGLLPPRRNRRCPRVRHPPKNKYQARNRTRPRPPDAITYTITINTSTTPGHPRPAEPP